MLFSRIQESEFRIKTTAGKSFSRWNDLIERPSISGKIFEYDSGLDRRVPIFNSEFGLLTPEFFYTKKTFSCNVVAPRAMKVLVNPIYLLQPGEMLYRLSLQ